MRVVFLARIEITWHIKTLFCPGLHFQYFWKLLSLMLQIDCALIDILKLILCNSERRAQTDLVSYA